MAESICKSCENAETNDGKCREFQASDAQKECEFAEQGAYEIDCHCDRQCKWAAAGAYWGVCTDTTKSFEVA